MSIIDTAFKSMEANWTHFSSLAKLGHVWRANNRSVFNAAAHHKELKDVLGAEWAIKHARATVPACIAGRWGNVTVVENRFLDAGVENLRLVLSVVLQQASHRAF